MYIIWKGEEKMATTYIHSNPNCKQHTDGMYVLHLLMFHIIFLTYVIIHFSTFHIIFIHTYLTH